MAGEPGRGPAPVDGGTRRSGPVDEYERRARARPAVVDVRVADGDRGHGFSPRGPGRSPDRSDPAQRAAYPADQHDYYSRLHVADLRASVGRRAGDPAATRLVRRLCESSEEFGALWDLHEVAVRRNSRMRVLHPLIGPVDLDCQVLLAPQGDQRVILSTPPVGSDTGERLALLKVVGNGQFTPAT